MEEKNILTTTEHTQGEELNNDSTDVKALYEKFKDLIENQEKMPEGSIYDGPSLEELYKQQHPDEDISQESEIIDVEYTPVETEDDGELPKESIDNLESEEVVTIIAPVEPIDPVDPQ